MNSLRKPLEDSASGISFYDDYHFDSKSALSSEKMKGKLLKSRYNNNSIYQNSFNMIHSNYNYACDFHYNCHFNCNSGKNDMKNSNYLTLEKITSSSTTTADKYTYTYKRDMIIIIRKFIRLIKKYYFFCYLFIMCLEIISVVLMNLIEYML